MAYWKSLSMIPLLTAVALYRVWCISEIDAKNEVSGNLVKQVAQRLATAPSQQRLSWLIGQQPLDLPCQDHSLDESLQNSGTCLVRLQQFDSSAAIAILPGLDGQPGVAGVDDNGNGVVDDRSELGATHSDDRCESMSEKALREVGKTFLVLQRGAFMDVTAIEQVIPNAEKRVSVHGQCDGTPFAFLINDYQFSVETE